MKSARTHLRAGTVTSSSSFGGSSWRLNMQRVQVAVCLILVTIAREDGGTTWVVDASQATSPVKSELSSTRQLNVDLLDSRVPRADLPTLCPTASLSRSNTRSSTFNATSVLDHTRRTNGSERVSLVVRTAVDVGADRDANLRRRCPQVIIIGAKKAGTRALLEFLRIHPDVRAVGREVHFFDKNYHRGFEWYRRQMPVTHCGQLTVEKTPSYLISRNVPRRVRRMSKDVRLIVVLRDPVMRAVSDYTQASAKRRGVVPTFEQLAFVDVGGSNASTTTTVNTLWRAIQIGLYAVHVRRWLDQFRADQLHFVSGERLVADPAGVLADVQYFLGLRRVVTDKHFRFSRAKGFPCIVRDPQRAPDDIHCLGKTKGRTHPVIEPGALKRLRDFFRPHNDDLYRLTNMEFGWP